MTKSLQIAVDNICNYGNTLVMMSPSTPTPAEASDFRAAVIADAATRLGILQRLGELGMRLAEDVVERAIDTPYHPETKHEPARAFATVARAVRLTLVLQERMEARLIALRNGEPFTMDDAAVVRAMRGSRAAVNRPAPEDSLDETAERSDRPTETLRERESERFDERVSGPFEECVAAIHVDLGLKPGDDIPSTHGSVASPLRNVPHAAPAPWAATGAPYRAALLAGVRAQAFHPPNSG